MPNIQDIDRRLRRLEADRTIIDTIEPKYPKEGLKWWNPSSNLLKIFRSNDWENIN